MKIIIKTIENGYIMSVIEDKTEPKREFAYEHKDLEINALKNMLNDIIDLVGAGGTRYDRERLYVKIEPGDKYNDEE